AVVAAVSARVRGRAGGGVGAPAAATAGDRQRGQDEQGSGGGEGDQSLRFRGHAAPFESVSWGRNAGSPSSRVRASAVPAVARCRCPPSSNPCWPVVEVGAGRED